MGAYNEGEIDSLDLDRLYNYCMVMLMLLSKVQPGTLRAAVKEAEIAAWIKGGVYDVIYDEEMIDDKLNQTSDDTALKAALAAERERCIHACTKIANSWRGANSQALECVHAIRALGD